MRIKPCIRLLDQPFVKASFVDARFVAGHKQDGLPPGIKGKGDSPHAVIGLKAKFLHVGVARSVQGIYPRAGQRRPERLEKLRLCKELILHRGGQRIEFRIKGRVETNVPRHDLNMT